MVAHENVKFVVTIVEIEIDNFYKDMKLNINKFDSTSNIYDTPITTSIVGKFKDE